MGSRLFACALLATIAGAGCTGNAQPGSAQERSGDQNEPSPSAAEAPPSGPVDQEMVQRGAQLFQSKGCIGCHTIGKGRLTGPDLSGVTERRDYTWIMAMVINPDSMLKNDATARKLFAEYMTPMMNVGVTQEEARAIYEYLRQ